MSRTPPANDPADLARLCEGTLPQILCRQAARFGDAFPAVREKAHGIWEAYTWTQYLAFVRRVCLGLDQLGIRRGDHVVLIQNNHPEWLFSQLGAQAAGAVTLNLVATAIAEEFVAPLGRVQAAFVFVQDQEQADKLLEIRDRIGHVRRVIAVDPTGMRTYWDDPWLLSFRDLLALGEEAERRTPERFDRLVGRGRREDTAVLIQTSGTTGIPKLAMLSHRNFSEMGRMWAKAAAIAPGENWLSMSPPAWIVDQMWGFGVALVGGMTMNFPETPETVAEDFREIGPHLLITSSRFWEDMASRIRVRVADAAWINRRLFSWAESVGRSVEKSERQGKPLSRSRRLGRRIAQALVYRPLLDRVGCAHLRGAYTGGHPISPDVIRFFRAVGLNLKQCYGLTEAGGIFQVQPDGEVKAETVGRPLPGVEVRLAPDQEVQVRSPSVFSGYHRDYQATEAAFADGWLRTGDAGYLDEEGHLLIIGRKEEIIRNKQGEAFSPDFVETRLKFSPFVKEAVIFGEGRPFLTALVNIDQGNVGSWAEERLIPYTTYTDLSQQPAVEKLLGDEIRQVNLQLPDMMKIRKFLLLYKLLDADDEELTRTGKVRRRFVYGLYLPLIEAMYTGEERLAVKGKVRYRDGRVGEIETTVKILSVEDAGASA